MVAVAQVRSNATGRLIDLTEITVARVIWSAVRRTASGSIDVGTSRTGSGSFGFATANDNGVPPNVTLGSGTISWEDAEAQLRLNRSASRDFTLYIMRL